MTAVKLRNNSDLNPQDKCRWAAIDVHSDEHGSPNTSTMELANMEKNDRANVADAEANDMDGDTPDQPKPKVYPKGWKLHTLTAG